MLRRAFLSQLTGSMAFAGAAVQPPAASAPAAAGAFTPVRHDLDAWYAQVPGRHRVVFDTWLADHFNLAVAFANNQFRVNRDAYGLADADPARPGELLDQGGGLARPEPPLQQAPCQRAALDPLQRQKRLALVLADLEHLHDIGMLQPRHRLGLDLKTRAFLGPGVAVKNHLQGDQAMESLLSRLVNDTHAAFA